MDLYEVMRSRRSIRSFSKMEVPQQLIEKVITAACWSPSPMNIQPWSFIVASGEKRDELVKIISKYPKFLQDIFDGSGIALTDDMVEFVQNFAQDVGGAPSIIIIATDNFYGVHWQDLANRSCAMAALNLMLAAYAEGLGTVYLTSSLSMADEVKQYLKIYDREISIIMPIGYWTELPPPPERKLPPNIEWLK